MELAFQHVHQRCNQDIPHILLGRWTTGDGTYSRAPAPRIHQCLKQKFIYIFSTNLRVSIAYPQFSLAVTGVTTRL